MPMSEQSMNLGELIVSITEGATVYAMKDGWPSSNDGGHIGVMQDIVRCAVAVDEWERTDDSYLYEYRQGLPGVYLYEMIEPMGAWFIMNYPCEPQEFVAELAKRFSAWIAAAA